MASVFISYHFDADNEQYFSGKMQIFGVDKHHFHNLS